MSISRKVNCFPIGFFKDADEPVICRNSAVVLQNLFNGSKITIYNILTGEMKSISMKNILCFNVHADNKNIVFEFSGLKRGIGIVDIESLKLTEVFDLGADIVLGGIWKDYIVFRRSYDIILFNMKEKQETKITSCHHIVGAPVVGNGSCAWLQQHKGKYCVAFYDIENNKTLFLSSYGYINKIYMLENRLIYQNCSDNVISIYAYDMRSGFLSKIFESSNWVELYKGGENFIVWTVRKEDDSGYAFDVWVYNACNDLPIKIFSDKKNAVIPAVSGGILLFIDIMADGDSALLMCIDEKNANA